MYNVNPMKYICGARKAIHCIITHTVQYNFRILTKEVKYLLVLLYKYTIKYEYKKNA